jgi:hypothetical protein
MVSLVDREVKAGMKRASAKIPAVGGVTGNEWVLELISEHSGKFINTALDKFKAKIYTLIPFDHSILNGRLNLKELPLRTEGVYELKKNSSNEFDEAVRRKQADCAEEIDFIWKEPLGKLSDMREVRQHLRERAAVAESENDVLEISQLSGSVDSDRRTPSTAILDDSMGAVVWKQLPDVKLTPTTTILDDSTGGQEYVQVDSTVKCRKLDLFVEEARIQKGDELRLKLDAKSSAMTVSSVSGEEAAKLLRRWGDVHGEAVEEDGVSYAAEHLQSVYLRVHKAMHVYAIEYCRPKLKGMMANLYQEATIRKALLGANVQVQFLDEMKEVKAQTVATLEAHVQNIRRALEEFDRPPSLPCLLVRKSLPSTSMYSGAKKSEEPMPEGSYATLPPAVNTTCRKSCSIM